MSGYSVVAALSFYSLEQTQTESAVLNSFQIVCFPLLLFPDYLETEAIV